jgi:hypothetical protein
MNIPMGLKNAWMFMISLFNFERLESNIRDEIPRGRGRYGIPSYAAGIMLALFTLFMLTVITILTYEFFFDELSESYFSVTQKPELTYGFFISSFIYFGLILFPYLSIGSLLYQSVIFAIIRLLGGRGSYKKQYFITSYVTLALGVLSLGFIPSFLIGVFLPCLFIFYPLIFIITGMYLVFYVQTKMIMILHKSQFAPSLVAIIIATILSVLAFIVVNLIIDHFGLFPDFRATFSMSEIGENIFNINMSDANSNQIVNATNSSG